MPPHTQPTLEYEHTWLTKIINFVFALLFLFITLYLFAHTKSSDDLVIIAFLFILFILILYEFLQLFAKIRIDRFGLSLSYPLREEIHIAWAEISKISSDWTDQRVKVFDELGIKKVTFSADLPGFVEIIDDIYANRPDLFLPKTDQSFTIGLNRILQYLFTLIVYGIVAFVIVDSGVKITIGGLMILVGSITVTYLFLHFFGMLTLKLTFDNNVIRVTSFFQNVVIPRECIRNVFLTTWGNKSPIRLSMKLYYHLDGSNSDKSLTISGLSCGSPYLYGAIQSWIDSGK